MKKAVYTIILISLINFSFIHKSFSQNSPNIKYFVQLGFQVTITNSVAYVSSATNSIATLSSASGSYTSQSYACSPPTMGYRVTGSSWFGYSSIPSSFVFSVFNFGTCTIPVTNSTDLRFNGTSYTSPCATGSFYADITPRLQMDVVTHLVGVGDNLILNVTPYDPIWTGLINMSSASFEFSKDGGTTWVSRSATVSNGTCTIPYSAIVQSETDWTGKEIQVRITQTISGNKYYGVVRRFMYLPKVTGSCTASTPTCVGDADAVLSLKLDNSPVIPPTDLGEVKYLANVVRVVNKNPDGSCPNCSTTYSTVSCVYNNTLCIEAGRTFTGSLTQSLTMSIDNTSLPCSETTCPGFLKQGEYRIQIECRTQPDNTILFIVSDLPVHIYDPPALTASTSYPWDATGFNMRSCDASGALNLTISNGVAPFTITKADKTAIMTLSNPAVTNQAGFPLGTYPLLVTDSKGCSYTTGNVTFAKPTLSLTSATGNPPSCNSSSLKADGTGNTNGSVTYSIDNTNSTTYSRYTVKNYIKNGPETTFNNLGAGDYTVKIEEGVGCPQQLEAAIVEPAVVAANLSYDPINCYGNTTSITINGVGETPATEYSLNDVDPWVSTSTKAIGFSGSASGTLYIRNGNLCETSTSYLVPAAPPKLYAGVRTILDKSCSTADNGYALIRPSGGIPYASGYTILLTDNLSVIAPSLEKSNLQQKTYSLTVRDSKSCQRDTSFAISVVSNPLSFGTLSKTDAWCENKPYGGMSIPIKLGERAFLPYQVSLSGTRNRTHPEITTVSDISAVSDTFNLPQGNYTISITDNALCQASQNFTIDYDSNRINLSDTSTSAAKCMNSLTGKVNAQASAGYPFPDGKFLYNLYNNLGVKINSIQESGANFDYSNGNYTVEAVDSRGCISSKSGKVSFEPTPVHFIRIDSVAQTCKEIIDGSYTINAKSIYPIDSVYQVGYKAKNDLPFVLSNKSANKYDIRAIDNKGCKNDTTITISLNKNTVTLSEPDPGKTSCNGASNGQISVDALSTGGYTDILYYLYKKNIVTPIDFNASGDFSGLSQGNYEVKAKYATYCFSAAKDVEILPNSSPVSVSISKLTDQSCTSVVNGSFTATASSQGAQTYTITDIQLDNVSISPFANPAPFSGKSAGTYVIKAIDNNNCFAEESVVIENLGNNPHFTVASFDSTACSSATNGAIHFTTTQPDPKTPYIYKRITGAIETPITIEDNAYNNLSNSTYTISITDAEGCSSKSDVQVPVSKRVISLKQPILTDSATCSGAPTGKIHVSNVPNTGFGSISYIVKQSGNVIGTNSSGNFQGLTDGLYYVKAFDGFNCETPEQWVLLDISKLNSVHISAVKIADQSCAAVNNGRIQVSATSTYGGDSYNISKIKIYRNNVKKDSTITASDTLFGGLNTGNYKIIVTDQHNCTNQQLVTISNLNNIPHPNIASFDSTDCMVASNGVINFKTAQLIPRLPYTWFKAPNENPENLLETGNNGIYHYSGVKSGTTSIRIKDNEGCYRDTVVEVPVTKQLLNINLSKVINASCPGSSNGKAFYQRANGVPFKKGYCFEVINTTTLDKEDSVFSPNIAVILGGYKKGTYQVVVTDSLHCTTNHEFTLTEPGSVKIDSLINRVKAKNGSDGRIETFITGGNSKYEYQWFKILNNSPASLMPVSDTTDLHAVNDPAIVSLSDMKAGKYRILIRDTANCIFEGATDWITRNFIIPEPTIELGLSITNNKSVSCFGLQDGSLQFSGTGGWNNYQYSSSLNPSVWSSSQEIKNLPKGTYELLVKDDEGIIFTKQVGVNQPDLLSVQKVETKDALCFGSKDGKASLMVTGGNYPYWVSTNSDGSNAIKDTIIATLGGGTHTIYVRDSLYCGTSAIVFIGQPSSRVSLADTIITESRCGQNYGTIQVLPQGGNPGTGYEYFWKYSNVITKKDSVFVANNTASNLYSGLYKLSIKDSHACIDTFDLFVPDITDLIIDSVVTQKALCQYDINGQASVYISKGNPAYTITWPDGSNNSTVQGMKAGNNYYVYVTDQKKCKVQKKFVIGHQNNIPYPNVAAFDSAACIVAGNGAIHFNITEHLDKQPYNYYLLNNAVESPVIGSGQNFVYSGLFSKGYNIRVKDKENCYNDTVIAVPMTKLPVQLMLDSITASSCIQSKNGKLYLSGRNGVKEDGGIYHYQLWSGETQNGISAMFAGLDPQKLHSVHVYDKYNCPDSISNITIPVESNHLTLTYPEIKDVSCYGYSDGKATINLHNGIRSYRYDVYNTLFTNKVDSLLSSNSIADFKGLRNGNYRIDVKDSVNCLSSGLFTIGSPLPFSMANRNIIPLCTGVNNGEISVDMNGGTPAYSYSWSNGKTGNTIKKLSAGNYSLTVTDSHNCTQNYSLNLTYEKTIKPNLGPNITLCSGNGHTLRVGNFADYQWHSNQGFTSSDSVIKVTTPDLYSVMVTDADGCIGSDTIQVYMSATPMNAEFLMASQIIQNDTLMVIESSWPSADSVIWDLPARSRVIARGDYYEQVIMPDTGLYNITLKAFRNDCFDLITKQVEVLPRSATNSHVKSAIDEMIKKYVVYPNPSSGNFSVEVKLREPAEGTLKLVSLAQGRVIHIKQIKGSDSYLESYSLPSLPVGAYALYLQVGKESKTITIIKQ